MRCVVGVFRSKVFIGTMVDTNRDNNNAVASKGILKRRIFIRNDGPPQQSTTAVAKSLQDGGCCLANACKRCVTFDETITIKNDKDLVVKKPLKLELVIDNWKSNGAKTPTETIQPDPGIVRRLVDEFNTIEEPFTDSSEIESTSIEEDKVKEDKPMESRTNVPLCEALESKAIAAKLTNGKSSLHGRSQSSGRVTDLINMFNSKSTDGKTEELEMKFIDF